MTYAAITDVNALIAKFPVSGTTIPTETQATTIMGYVSGQIDGALGALGYTTPVVTPSGFVDALKLLNAQGAAALVLWSMFPAQAGPAEASAGKELWKAYQSGLAQLAKGMGIPSSVPSSSSTQMKTYLSENPDEEIDIGELAEPVFPIDKVF